MSLFCLMVAASASAATVFDAGDNRVTLITDLNGSFQSVDVRGLAFLSVSTPGADVILIDNFGGANVSPFPNATLFGINPTVTEAMTFQFVFANSVFGATFITVPVLVAPLTPITDPNLAALIFITSLRYSLTNVSTDSTSAAYTYRLAQVNSIPEPANFTLSLAGLMFLAGIVKLRRLQA